MTGCPQSRRAQRRPSSSIGGRCNGGVSTHRACRAGTEIRFKPRTLWEERKGLIVTVSSLLLLQAVSLVALLVQRQRRDAAEVQAHAHRNDLAHLSRVALLGELSTSFAHELNQPLTAILSYAQAAQRFLDMPDPNLDNIRVILADIASNDRRAADVIQRLRELMKKGEPRLQTVQCQEIVESVLRLAAQDLVSREVQRHHGPACRLAEPKLTACSSSRCCST